jgi:hypothetical protein
MSRNFCGGALRVHRFTGAIVSRSVNRNLSAWSAYRAAFWLLVSHGARPNQAWGPCLRLRDCADRAVTPYQAFTRPTLLHNAEHMS